MVWSCQICHNCNKWDNQCIPITSWPFIRFHMMSWLLMSIHGHSWHIMIVHESSWGSITHHMSSCDWSPVWGLRSTERRVVRFLVVCYPVVSALIRPNNCDYLFGLSVIINKKRLWCAKHIWRIWSSKFQPCVIHQWIFLWHMTHDSHGSLWQWTETCAHGTLKV